MIDFRPLSDRFDLTYVRRRHGIDRLLVPLSILAVLLVAGVITAVTLTNDNRLYSSGNLTFAHDMFANDCFHCHQQDPDRSGFWLPARDEACLNCHEDAMHSRHGSAHPGGSLSFVDDEHALSRDCASCHVEHLGRDHNLARVPDTQCTVCHSDLDSTGRVPGEASRGRPTHARVSSFVGDHPDWHVLTSGQSDPGDIRLNHKLHVVDEDISCSVCHVVDRSGRYFEPITFDAHCRSCHEADLGTVSVAKGIVDSFIPPHGSADALAEQIRDHFALAAARFGSTPEAERGDSAGQEEEKPSRRRRGRGNKSAAPAGPVIPEFASREALDAWISEETVIAVNRLSSSCSKCHSTTRTETGFEVAPANITPIWLDRAVFSHSAHSIVRCDECHSGARSSERTSDVLLPGIALCLSCHTPDVGAPSDCATCHTYHDHTVPWNAGDRKIRDLLSAYGFSDMPAQTVQTFEP